MHSDKTSDNIKLLARYIHSKKEDISQLSETIEKLILKLNSLKSLNNETYYTDIKELKNAIESLSYVINKILTPELLKAKRELEKYENMTDEEFAKNNTTLIARLSEDNQK
ncbi:MAG: hypothetical protein MR904_00080 [Clostridia bacterium]|nr:hypothetical protein [Clostridia bacterium]